MARSSPSSWAELERFEVPFDVVASGWEDVKPPRMAKSLRESLRRDLRPVEEQPEPGRLFLVGDLGQLARGQDTRLLQAAGSAIGLRGNVRIKQRSQSLAGPFLRMEQRVRKLPIYGSDLTLHLDRDQRGYCLTGSPVPREVAIGRAKHDVGPDRAREIVGQALGVGPKPVRVQVGETLLPTREELLPCYHVRMFTWEPFGSWYGFVAKQGGLLALYNVASACAAADAYETSPRRSKLRRVSLGDLAQPVRHLEGPNSRVWRSWRRRIAARNGDFIYDPSDAEFDQPQLFYFLNACRAAIQGLVPPGLIDPIFDRAPFRPMVGTVHVAEAADNAYFEPETGELLFGDIHLGGGTRYTSRSLDIVLHEFGHAVTDTVCRLGRAKPHEASRAMDEGYADYLAATVLDNPVIGDYFVNRDEGFRNCSNRKRFPAGYAGEEHAVGEVWAGFLWSLRSHAAIGRQVADALVLQSLSYLGPWRSIPQGLEAVLQADRQLHPAGQGQGRHEQVIRQEFDRRRP